MQAGVGYGNWLTPSIWTDGFVPAEDQRLESFSIAATPSDTAATLTYRLAVGLLDDRGRWAGDLFSTPWQTDSSLTATIPGGLELTSGLNYLAYLVPESAGWTMATTLTNGGPGVVGVALLFYTDSHLVDTDLPHDRDVAMQATFSQVPEPSTLALLAVGLVVLWRISHTQNVPHCHGRTSRKAKTHHQPRGIRTQSIGAKAQSSPSPG